jgi:cysteine desulfuration protein SufE
MIMVIILVIMVHPRLICHQSLSHYRPHWVESSTVSNRYRSQDGGMNTCSTLPNVCHRFPPDQKIPENRVSGCASQVYVIATVEAGKVRFQADSDAQITKGLVGLLVEGLDGLTPMEIMQLTPDFIQQTGLDISLTPSRANGFYNIFQMMQKRALVCHLTETYSHS